MFTPFNFSERFSIRNREKQIARYYWLHLAAIAKVDGKNDLFREYLSNSFKRNVKDMDNVSPLEILKGNYTSN